MLDKEIKIKIILVLYFGSVVNGERELLYQWPTPSQRVWVGSGVPGCDLFAK